MRISKHHLFISAFNAVIILAVLISFFSGVREKTGDGQTEAEKADLMSWPVFTGNRTLNGVVPERRIPGKPEVLWDYLTDESIVGTPVVSNGTVYAGSLDCNVYALDLETGVLKWKTELNGDVEASPMLLDDTVYAGTKSHKGTMYALSAADGALRWTFETGHHIIGSANWDDIPGVGVGIMFGSHDNYMYCVNRTDGSLIWEYRTQNFINGAPAVDNGMAVFGGCDANVYGVSTETGTPLSIVDAGAYIAGSACISGGNVFVGNYDGALMCIDMREERIVWTFENEAGEPFFGTPSAEQDVVYAGCRDGFMYALKRKDGAVIWKYQARDSIDSSPVITGDSILFGSDDGRVYVLNKKDGSLVWDFEIGEEISSSVAVLDNMILVGCRDGGVYAIGDSVNARDQ